MKEAMVSEVAPAPYQIQDAPFLDGFALKTGFSIFPGYKEKNWTVEVRW